MAESLEFSDSDSDCDSEIPDINFKVGIQPYMFEPEIVDAKGVEDYSSDSSSEGVQDDDNDHVDFPFDGAADAVADDVLSNSEPSDTWCSCGNCSEMQTKKENKCCVDTNIVDGKMEEGEVSCITEHEGFIANCLNRYVLETSYYEYKEENGPVQPDQFIHEIYRYLAYRRFVRWIYQRLGKRNRRILPACVVIKIRETFPSEQYCGFKYPN